MRTLKELSDLSGRRALITGGAGHVGRVAAEALSELGAIIAILDKAPPNGRWYFCCDLSNEEELRAVIRHIGHIEILVHCAAYIGEDWEKSVKVNIQTPMLIIEEIGGHLKSVILISSIYGMVAPDRGLYTGTNMINPVAYVVTKGGLLQLTRYLATILAPDIRVNAISPGGIWRSQPKVFRKRYEARTPLGRMATEEDLKGAIAYLASDLSSYVTGHNLVVDGGWTTW